MKFCAIVLALLVPCLAAPVDSGSDNIKGNAWGNPNAPIRMEIFSDFQCPACKNLHDNEVPQLMRDFVASGKMYLIYRYFPLPLQVHRYGKEAAELVCAASQVGKYEPAANAVFAQQAAWSASGKVEEALNGVLTPAEAKKVKALTKDPVVQSWIQRDVDEARTVPVTQTPTLLVTYRLKRYPIAGLNNYGLLKSFLDGLLAK
jgi:protein-disulfide isomerase